MDLTSDQLAFLQRHLGLVVTEPETDAPPATDPQDAPEMSEAPPPPGTEAPENDAPQALDLGLPPATGTISIVKLGQARLAWEQARKDAASSVTALAKHIEDEYQDEQGTEAVVAEAVKTLGTSMGHIHDRLEDQLDAVLNAEAEERPKLAIVPAGTAQDFLALCDSDPILSALDGNEFMADMKVIGPMKDTLKDVVVALGR